MYRINNEAIGIMSRPELEETQRKNPDSCSVEEVMEFQEVCFLCGQVYHRDSMKLLYTRPPEETSKHSMFFPFVAKLQRHAKAKAIDIEGRVTSCRACYSYLQRQWQSYQSEGIPAEDREFILRPLTNTGTEDSLMKITPKEPHPSRENGQVNQPLNIDISSSGPVFSVPAPGLLAIAPGLTPQVMMSMIPIQSAMYHQYQQQLAAATSQSSVIVGINQSAVSAIVPKKGNRPDKRDKEPSRINAQKDSQQVSKTTNEFPSKSSKSTWCYVCGFKCTGDKYYILKSSKTKRDNDSVSPIFPFLRNRDPASRAEKMSIDGTVKTCRYCYYTLIYQWDIYERSGEIKDQYHRKYNVDTFVCFLCAKNDIRKNTRTVDLRCFPELVERNRPFGSLVMEEECSVAVCVSCEHQLATQYSEFEEKNIAVGQRAYNISGAPSNNTMKHSSQVCRADPEPVKPDSYLPKHIDPQVSSV